MKEVVTKNCLLEADPLDIQLRIGRDLGILTCGKCDRSCLAKSLSEVEKVGMILYFKGDEEVDGAVSLAEACKTKDGEIRKAIIAIEVTGNTANEHRQDMPWGETGFEYQTPLADAATQIRFTEPL
jgi:hypothetical protein